MGTRRDTKQKPYFTCYFVAKKMSRFIFFLVLIAMAFAAPNSPPVGIVGTRCYGNWDCDDGLVCGAGRPYRMCQRMRCSSTSQCQPGMMCNFDYGSGGYCESCEENRTMSDCKRQGFINRKGQEECYDVCAYNEAWKVFA